MIDKERQFGGERAGESSEPVETGVEDQALAPCELAEQDETETDESGENAGDSVTQLRTNSSVH